MAAGNRFPRGEKFIFSRGGAGRREGAEVLSSALSPSMFRQKLNSFIDHQRSLVKNLAAGNVRLIDVGALVPPEIREQATKLAGDIIQRSLGTNDLLVPCGDDGFVILFHTVPAKEADERTREIGDKLAEMFLARRELRGIAPRTFTYDLTRYLDSRWAGTLDDLKRVVRQAYEDHVAELKAQTRRAADTDTVRFGPVVATAKKLLVGYDVRLYQAEGPQGRRSPPFLGIGSAAERAEMTALTVERLAFRLGRMTEALANVLLFVPIASDILTNTLYWANFEAELFALPAHAQRRVVLNLDLSAERDPEAFLARHRARLAGKGRGLIVSLPVTSQKMIDIFDLELLGLSAVSDKRIEADQLKRFVRRCDNTGLRSFWLEHQVAFDETEVVAAKPTYIAIQKALPEIQDPQARYQRSQSA